jgi:glycerophosphoryl diester phosphodiesterase
MTAFYIVLAIIGAILWLYVLAILPSLRYKKEFADLKKFYYAHRGLHDNQSEAPENSLPAFRKAVAAGYGSELDIQLTKDKQVVVFHDDSLERACGKKGFVSDFTYEELKEFKLFGTEERIPLFSEVLRAVGGRTPLIVEYKIRDGSNDVSVCAYGDELLRNYHGLYCIESFHPLAVRWYKKHHRAIVRGQLVDKFTEQEKYRSLKFFALQNLLFNFLCKPDFIAYNHVHGERLSLGLCHRAFGRLAVAWTITSQEELKKARLWFDIFIFEGFVPSGKPGGKP